MAERYEQSWEGKWEDWRWKGTLEMCCDCCLTHRVNYRVKNGGLQRKVFLDRPKTYAARRRAGIKIVKTK